MELFITLLIIAFFAIGYALEKATGFIKQLKTSGSANLSKGFKAELSIVPIHKKSEVCGHTQTPNQNNLD